jgi:lipopolysaccharide transport system ATP-binding protein
MSRPIIEVENLSKRYRLGQFGASTLREEVEQFLARFRKKWTAKGGNLPDESSEFWALKDISFCVQPGEVVGIIGRNGAGKSTLLKILSRVTEPTEGEGRIRGRVASLLEVGTGFHPELTGRENIYLNGAILGMTRSEIREKFDEIVGFAEIDRFLDTPVKRYSSGMYVRLAFAVAAHLDPEILVVDEVLAVGDVEFQKKCLGKMQSASAIGGRTVLFVSHNMTAVTSLCSRALLMESGRIAMAGDVKSVIGRYLNSVSRKPKFREQVWDDFRSAPGNEHIRVRRIQIVPEDKYADSEIGMDASFEIVIEYWNLTSQPKLVLNLYFFTLDGTPVFESVEAQEVAMDFSLIRSTCYIPANLLNEGEFIIQINFLNERLHRLFDFAHAAYVSIRSLAPREVAVYGRFDGHVHPKLAWHTDTIDT